MLCVECLSAEHYRLCAVWTATQKVCSVPMCKKCYWEQSFNAGEEGRLEKIRWGYRSKRKMKEGTKGLFFISPDSKRLW